MTQPPLSSETFLSAAIAALPDLATVIEDQIDDWAPQKVPGTILYAAIGDRLARTDREVLRSSGIFDLVERAMRGTADGLDVWVATGLIEGLIAKGRTLGTWPDIASLLGPQSRSHAEAWDGTL